MVLLDTLPLDCLSTILSLTSPPDACRASAVSTAFQSAAESDLVWDRFLPADYRNLVSAARLSLPPHFSSKRNLFFHLCDGVLIDDGRKSFALERSSGRKSYILSARELSVSQGNELAHWSWKSTPQSRFSEAAELKTIGGLEIEGKLRTGMLSRNSEYGAYLVIKITENSYGLDSIPSEVKVSVGDRLTSKGTAYVRCPKSGKHRMETLFYGNRVKMMKNRVDGSGEERMAMERGDGWLEMELGRFSSGEGNEEVGMSFSETKGHQLKSGLILEGIELRPLR